MDDKRCIFTTEENDIDKWKHGPKLEMLVAEKYSVNKVEIRNGYDTMLLFITRNYPIKVLIRTLNTMTKPNTVDNQQVNSTNKSL
jgi:hypothetical protein